MAGPFTSKILMYWKIQIALCPIDRIILIETYVTSLSMKKYCKKENI